MIYSLLAGFNLLEQGYTIGLDILGKFAQWIIAGVGVIGWGVIIFTLVLKAITLPFDIYQRVSTRKQNLIMEGMKDDLEKLKKQYANDEKMYNQKMMELYKKHGYSMFGACLPTIFSLVILIVAFQGFNNYSSYANLAMYEEMSVSYNAAILEHAPETVDIQLLSVGEDVLTGEWDAQKGATVYKVNYVNAKTFTISYKTNAQGEQIALAFPLHCTFFDKTAEEGGVVRNVRIEAEGDENFMFYSYSLENGNAKKEYEFDSLKLKAYIAADEARQAAFDAIHAAAVASGETQQEAEPIDAEYNRYLVKVGATAAADWYRDGHNASFLWVKNVWYPDVAYNHPIAPFSSFKKQLGAKKVKLESGEKNVLTNVLTETNYNNLTSELSVEKSQPNGYFILIILSIGLMVLSQWITMRSSKDANQYQTVDGRGAKSQKMMMIIMPLIYAVFAFMYSAAFSIYMTVSSAISLVVTVLSNLIIGRVFKKREERQHEASVTRKYTWQMTEKEKKQLEKDEKRLQKQKEREERERQKKRKL